MNLSHFIDRRKNPSGKSLGNRQRFLKRAKAQIKEAVNKSLRDRSLKEINKGEKISIPSKSTAEPRFRLDPETGERDVVHPGNKEFSQGDKVKKPPRAAGKGKGKKASKDGDGEDSFQFTLTQDEFLDIFFEDLELPNLVKRSLKEIKAYTFKTRRHYCRGFANQYEPHSDHEKRSWPAAGVASPVDQGNERTERALV